MPYKLSTCKKIMDSNPHMIQSIQLDGIQAFTALWKMKIEQMVIILNFYQKIKTNDNILYVNNKAIIKSW